MRIGISTSVIERGKTGIAQYVFALVRALLQHHPQHQLVLFVLEEDLGLFQFAEGSAQLVPVPECFRPPIRNILWHQRFLPPLVRSHRIDVLHIPSYRRLLWNSACPTVATVHDLAPYHVAGKYDWKRMIYARIMARHFLERQNEIIAVSRHTAQDLLVRLKLPSQRVTVIHNGLEHDRFSPGPPAQAKSEARERYHLTQPFFLYVARLEHPTKNHLRLIEAFDGFKSVSRSPWQLVFAGNDWHGAGAIHQRIGKSRFARDIRCLGFVRDADLPSLYRAADVFVYPSLYEGFGMPPLEAMACGCPVLSSGRGSLDEVLGDAGITSDPENIGMLSKQLARLATDSELRERLRRAGIERARQFDWQTTARSTVQIYARAFELRAPLQNRHCRPISLLKT